jgi:hypothetical protein
MLAVVLDMASDTECVALNHSAVTESRQTKKMPSTDVPGMFEFL